MQGGSETIFKSLLYYLKAASLTDFENTDTIKITASSCGLAHYFTPASHSARKEILMFYSDWKPERRRAFVLGMILLILLAGACLFLIRPRTSTGQRRIARITQNGAIIREIDLSAVTKSFTIQLDGENGAYNIIEVRPGSIGIIEASCPDQLCVHMGFIQDTALPVTCLPNRVVIQILTES